MESSRREKLESGIRELCESREYGRAVALSLEGYGAEIRKLLWVVLKNEDWVDDSFGVYAEAVLKSLPGFRWESSFRTWAHRVARNTCSQFLRDLPDQERPVTEGALAERPYAERTVTQPWLRTDIKNRFRALHDKLSPHERMLLALRVDAGQSWVEIARAMAGPEPSAEALDKKACVLRQQFQRLKGRLRSLALEEQLLLSRDS